MLAHLTALLVGDLKPFFWVQKFQELELLGLKNSELMTINHSLDDQAFEVFIEKFLVPELWVGAVVVRDNLPADKMAYIAILNKP
jgi:hypothetical protein